MKRLSIPLLAVGAVALVVAGCGGGSKKKSSSTTSAAPAAPATTTPSSSGAGGGATVDLRNTSLGKVLVGGNGMTLYLFEKDKGPKSTCSGACASAWPPLTTSGKPKAGSGVKAAKLGITKRGDGTTEVTYNGHPLYFYAGDSTPGQTNGQGLNQFGAEWYVLSAKGDKVENGEKGGS
jgi:predicted lipoprotein with Yx(FWY)xxD motif